MSWISVSEVTPRLKAEAENDFKRLGHNMGDWMHKDAHSIYARCRNCDATCTISPRLVGKMRLRGDAVVLPCSPKK